MSLLAILSSIIVLASTHPNISHNTVLNQAVGEVVLKNLQLQDPKLRDLEIRFVSKAIISKDGHRIVEAASYRCRDSGCDYEVLISEANMQLYNGNINWLSGTIGHELGHIANGDFSNPLRVMYCGSTKAHNRQCEKDADLYGKHISTQAGYDGCDIANFWRMWLTVFGNNRDMGQNIHPDVKTTINYMECK